MPSFHGPEMSRLEINYDLLDGHTQYDDGSWILKLQAIGLKRLGVKNRVLGEKVASRLNRRQMQLEYGRANLKWANETVKYWTNFHYFN